MGLLSYLPQSSCTILKQSPKIFTGPTKKLYIVICRIFELNHLSTLNRLKLPKLGVRELEVDLTSHKTKSGIAYFEYISEYSIVTPLPQAYWKYTTQIISRLYSRLPTMPAKPFKRVTGGFLPLATILPVIISIASSPSPIII
jgi:hypothetical protein